MPEVVPPQGVRADFVGTPQAAVIAAGVIRRQLPLNIQLSPAGRPLGFSAQPILAKLPSGSTVEALVTWELTGPFTVSPARVHFGVVDSKKGGERKRSVSLNATGAGKFLIHSVESDNPGLTAKEVKEPNGTSDRRSVHVVELTLSKVKPQGVHRTISGRVRVKTDLPAASDIIVPWSVFTAGADVDLDKPTIPNSIGEKTR